MGPALKLASQTMISLTLLPVAVLEVKRSYAILATMVPVALFDQFHVVYGVFNQIFENKEMKVFLPECS
jgi:hypothetical protein